MARLFEDRERAEELYFARSEEARFLAHCRALRQLGAFATSKLGVDGESARAYSDELVGCLAFGSKDEAIIAKVKTDLANSGIDVSEADLKAELTRYLAIAEPAPSFGTVGIVRPPRPLER